VVLDIGPLGSSQEASDPGIEGLMRKLHALGLGSRMTIEDRANRIGVVRAMACTACTKRLQASVDEAVMRTSLVR
jgi:hypothetical protein